MGNERPITYLWLFTLIITLIIVHTYFANPFDREFTAYDDNLAITPLADINTLQDYWNFMISPDTYAYPLRDLIWKFELTILEATGITLFWINSLLLFVLCLAILYFILAQENMAFQWRLITISIIAFHPVMVELVQWASARRILWCLFFALLYIWYSNNQKNLAPKSVVILLGIYIISLLFYPCTLLLPLYTAWKYRTQLGEYKILSLTMSGIVFLFLSIFLVTSSDWKSIFFQDFFSRIPQMTIYFFMVLGRYTWNGLIPLQLTTFYDPVHIFNFIGLLMFTAIVFFTIKFHKKINKQYLVASLLLFLPTLGIILAKDSFTAADRYFGLFLPFLIIAFARLIPKNKTSKILAYVIILIFVVLTFMQTPTWETSDTIALQCVESEASPRCLAIQIERHFENKGCEGLDLWMQKYEYKKHASLWWPPSSHGNEIPFYKALCAYQSGSINPNYELWSKPTTLPVQLLKDPSIELVSRTVSSPNFSFEDYTPKLVSVLRGQLTYLCEVDQEYCQHKTIFLERISSTPHLVSPHQWGYKMQKLAHSTT